MQVEQKLFDSSIKAMAAIYEFINDTGDEDNIKLKIVRSSRQ